MNTAKSTVLFAVLLHENHCLEATAMDKKQAVYKLLDERNIVFEAVEHPAVYTIEEMDALTLPHPEAVVKNLFLRDAKGKRHFLVVMDKNKSADLKRLRDEIGCTALSFASEERLAKYLALTKGEVTPFGVLNDEERAVEVFFDRDLENRPLLGVHPNDNTATVFVSFAGLWRVLKEHGSPLGLVKL